MAGQSGNRLIVFVSVPIQAGDCVACVDRLVSERGGHISDVEQQGRAADAGAILVAFAEAFYLVVRRDTAIGPRRHREVAVDVLLAEDAQFLSVLEAVLRLEIPIVNIRKLLPGLVRRRKDEVLHELSRPSVILDVPGSGRGRRFGGWRFGRARGRPYGRGGCRGRGAR